MSKKAEAERSFQGVKHPKYVILPGCAFLQKELLFLLLSLWKEPNMVNKTSEC
eukprot:m.165977 g.165977  ORF g.165977 m.165977 type:complete len:53 (+) comp38908_c0_seq3:1091-1249(+)